MYNLYNKNKTDDLVGREGTNFYIPIDAVLVELQDCPNKLAGIGSNNIRVIGSDRYQRQNQWIRNRGINGFRW
jgi:hypothetical protein